MRILQYVASLLSGACLRRVGVMIEIAMLLQKFERRCFVNLPNGGQKDFPTATRVKHETNGTFEIWDDCVFLARYKVGEYKGVWFSPQFLQSQKKEHERKDRMRRRRH
jgi:hypothetical protein